MLKYILAGLAGFVLLTATLIPDDAYARRGGGGGFPAVEAVFMAAASAAAACMLAAFMAALEGFMARAMRGAYARHIR